MSDTERKPLEFQPSYFHEDVLRRILSHESIPRDIPCFFSAYRSYELRKAALEKFSAFSGEERVIYSQDKANWEGLISFLKANEPGLCNEALFPRVLSIYLFNANNQFLKIPALRFAISLLESKHGVLLSGNDHRIIKAICACINNNNFCLSQHGPDDARENAKIFLLDGWFGILPEIKPVLQMMLNELFDSSAIFHPEEQLRVDYNDRDFVQVRRALAIILKEKRYDTSFLPFIEKMAILHKEKIRKLPQETARDTNLDNNPFFYRENQAVLDEAVRILKKAHAHNLKHDAQRRAEILSDFGEK